MSRGKKSSKVEIDESSPKRTSAPAQIVESVSNDLDMTQKVMIEAKAHEVARLHDLWRLNGVPAVLDHLDAILSLYPDAQAYPHVDYPLLVGEKMIPLKEIVDRLDNAEIKLLTRRLGRKVGISIYALVAFNNIEGKV